MATVRIYKVAELLNTTSQEVMALLKRDHGIDVKSASSTIEEVVGRQFVERLARQRGVTLPGGDLFADTISWLQAHLDQEVTVADLAARAAMSPRTFARRFPASTGTTPLTWILRERVRLAQRLLETTDLPVDAIAGKTGFGTADNLRKHFGRMLRTTPQAYRRTFRSPAAPLTPATA